MKKTLTYIVMLSVILLVHQAAFAQASYVPTFDQTRSSSIHIGFGQLNYNIDYHSSLGDDAEINQNLAIFGGNWEHHFGTGFLHLRVGFVGLGETDYVDGAAPFINLDWENDQEFSFYLGGGYMFMGETPISGFKPMYGNNNNQNKAMAPAIIFYGGGFDFNFYGQYAEQFTSSTDFKDAFHIFDLSLLGIAGVRFPQSGLVIHFGLSANILLNWEHRHVESTSTTETTTKLSDYADLEIPFIGTQFGIAYEMPSYPRVKIGFLVKAIDANMFIFHIGYVF